MDEPVIDDPAIIVADTEGRIQEWNEAAEQLFGHRAHDAVGASLDLVVPEHLREAHWAGFHHAMRHPELKDLAADLPVRCASGEIRTAPGRLMLLLDPFGDAFGAMAIYAADGSTGARPFG